MTERIHQLENEKKENYEKIKIVDAITADADAGEEKAIFLIDLVTKCQKWPTVAITLCTVWKFCSPKGYRFCHNHLVKLPSKDTICKYVAKYKGQNELIRQRLEAEIKQFKHPIECVCSLIVDDMAIKEKVNHSRSEDHIFGLGIGTCSTIGKKPRVANKMLCFVIHGLSSKFTIPVGYFFHATLTSKDFYLLTQSLSLGYRLWISSNKISC
ncbi:hypothetical protein Zmor_003842 [Zophobas morio]|uniref:Transposable element P transposase-like RNase H domain-containing protein n=1 Tax=Zophobas morio TaxID=2755281 RepID=A0AA38HNC9_9CUCU|nr:hypothetical protein Zmor_003842 [Zophobas morio]